MLNRVFKGPIYQSARHLQKSRKGIISNLIGGKRKEWRSALEPLNHVIQIGDPILRDPAYHVDFETMPNAELQNVVNRMKKVINKYFAAGLSAPQIGVPLRIISFQMNEDQLAYHSAEDIVKKNIKITPFTYIINPTVEVLDEEKIVDREGCMSFYEYSGTVERFKSVAVSGYDVHGKPLPRIEATGWTARVIQHEMDHLEGIMYVDKLHSKQSLAFNFWKHVNERGGRFKLTFKGTEGIISEFIHATRSPKS